MSNHLRPCATRIATACTVALAGCQLGPPPNQARDRIDAVVAEARAGVAPRKIAFSPTGLSPSMAGLSKPFS